MKKNTLVLDFDDVSSPFEDIAFLLFHSAVPNYAFVDDLNHLYELSLARIDDIEIMETPWPLFSYRDSLRHLTYHLIERPALTSTGVPHWRPAEKLLMIKGNGAEETAAAICDDFTLDHPSPNPADLRAADHAALLQYYQQSLTAVTFYNPLSQKPISRKTAKERAELEALLADIADRLDLAGE